MRDAATQRIDGEAFDLDWVDWDNDRHQEGWLAYMNLGVDSWRRWLTGRIAETIERDHVDAYFLDIVGGWMNNPQADMHEGTRRLVQELRHRYPQVMPCGEMLYDGLRGSSGVHEAGFGRFDPTMLNLRQGVVPTITVVDDTFETQRPALEAIIRRARELAGIG
jgi:hypothetical protein